jgi:exodeoxyribonuclease VII large subunit
VSGGRSIPGAYGRPRILTVTELAAGARRVLDEGLGWVWVAGELSSVRRSSARHVYFILKDEESQLAAVMFWRAAQTMPFDPADGLDVVVHGRLELYAPRGSLQLVVERMEPQGYGALRLAFEQLKGRLAAEGLFAAERKRTLRPVPRAVGIVTALEGAAVHDMLTTLRRRWPAARVVLRPVRVQGAGAAADVAAGIADLNRLGDIDVVLVGRGGGSLEDLWAFNEEVVARAIVASRVPVVSGVGHEIDCTIADLVADHRAATPTAAAAAAVPERERLLAVVVGLRDALAASLVRCVRRAGDQVHGLARRLPSPGRRVDGLAVRLGELQARLARALVGRVAWDRREVRTLTGRLQAGGPVAAATRARERLAALHVRLRLAIAARLRDTRAAVERAERQLGALSPLACLERGYAIVRRGSIDGPIVRDAAALHAGDDVALVLARGRAFGRIERTESQSESGEAT